MGLEAQFSDRRHCGIDSTVFARRAGLDWQHMDLSASGVELAAKVSQGQRGVVGSTVAAGPSGCGWRFVIYKPLTELVGSCDGLAAAAKS